MREVRNPSLSAITTLGLGGTCSLELTVSSRDDLAAMDDRIRELGLPVYVVGRGSNIFGLDGSRIIDLGGIMHLVTDRLCPSREQFDEIRAYVMEEWHPAAMGVMFLESAEDGCSAGSESDGVCHLSMTPYVYVADVDSTYAEGSCASGSEAAAAALSAGKTDGTYRYELTQPAGVITASCTVRNGQTAGCEIEGSVTCGEIQEYTLELS